MSHSTEAQAQASGPEMADAGTPVTRDRSPRMPGVRRRGPAGDAIALALVIAAFAGTRFLSINVWQLPVGDVGLYQRYAVDFWLQSPRLHALPVEYPALALLPFSLTLLPPIADYYAVYACWMGALAVLGFLGFLRYTTRRRAIVYTLYLAVGATATVLARFDLLPALLTLAALWATQRRHFTLSYVLLALGTLMKLYPIVFLPVVFIAEVNALSAGEALSRHGELARADRQARRWSWWSIRRRIASIQSYAWSSVWRASRGVLLALGIILLGFGLAAALDRRDAFTSFSYLGARPVQVESIPASLLWLGTLVGIPAGPTYSFSSLNFVGALDGALKPLSAVALVALCGLVYWRQLAGKLTAEQAFLGCVCVMLATNKVLSPQYLIWALPLVAAVEGFDCVWLAICILTTVVYPILYLAQPTFAMVAYTPAFMPMLALRNLCLVAVTVRAVRGRKRARSSSSTGRAPLDPLDRAADAPSMTRPSQGICLRLVRFGTPH